MPVVSRHAHWKTALCGTKREAERGLAQLLVEVDDQGSETIVELR